MASTAKEIRPVLLPYQRRWVEDGAPLKVWLASRQIGKSFALAMETVKMSIEARCNNLILSSSERQSKEVMQKVYSHLRVLNALTGDAVAAARENRFEAELQNGSRIISLPASPDTVRGFSGNVFLDEFAFHKDSREIWRAMYPTVTRGYKVRVTSTPNGKQNMFYDLWSSPDGNASRHRTTIHDAVADGLEVDVDELRRGIGDPDSWAQEFECAFIDEATAYLTYEMIASVEGDDALTDGALLRSDDPELYAGMDIGRHKDLSVIWVVEKVGDVLWTRSLEILRAASFAAQRERLYGMLEHTALKRCCIDSTGIGAQLAEEAVQRFGSRVEAVTFTGPVKEDLAVTLRRRFEDRLVRIPRDREVREDLHSVRKVTTASGNVRFDAARTDALGHADRFWALALAVHAASTPTGPVEYESVGVGRSSRGLAVSGGAFKRRGAW